MVLLCSGCGYFDIESSDIKYVTDGSGKVIDDQVLIAIENQDGLYYKVIARHGEPEERVSILISRNGKIDPVVPSPVDPVNPPDPVVPDPGPMKAFYVLVVYESDEATMRGLTAGQLAVINSVKVREYLDQHCTKIEGKGGYRFYDIDASVSEDSDVWKQAMDIARKEKRTLPFVLVTDGSITRSAEIPPISSGEEAVEKFIQFLKEVEG
ncbi:hypothetical protein KC887_00420 [Candidatus Kaiserbacteria bacterium]|nr:hypothetical protein [Candidatus Kaiserbacteria bacterium]